MSLLSYFKKANSLPTAKETGVGERLPKRQINGQLRSFFLSKPTLPSEETRAKIGKYAAIHGGATARQHFRASLGDLPKSTVRKYKNVYK